MRYVGKEVTAVEKGKEYTGVCTSTRTVSKGDQLFLKGPDRYFFVKDLAVPKLEVKKFKTPRPAVKKEEKLGSD